MKKSNRTSTRVAWCLTDNETNPKDYAVLYRVNREIEFVSDRNNRQKGISR